MKAVICMDTDQVVLKGLFLSGVSYRQHQLSNQLIAD